VSQKYVALEISCKQWSFRKYTTSAFRFIISKQLKSARN